MAGVEIGIASVIIILILIYAGIHVAVALGLVSFIGVWVHRESLDIAINLLAAAAHDSIAHAVFANIPLFALMGIVASEIGLGAVNVSEFDDGVGTGYTKGGGERFDVAIGGIAPTAVIDDEERGLHKRSGLPGGRSGGAG